MFRLLLRLLRHAEFATPSYSFYPYRHATLSNISFNSPDSLTYHLKRSKTSNPQATHLFRLNSFLSPYAFIHDHTRTRLSCHASLQDPLFTPETGEVATRSPPYVHGARQIRSSTPTILRTLLSRRSRFHCGQTGHPRQHHKNPRPLELACLPLIHPPRSRMLK